MKATSTRNARSISGSWPAPRSADEKVEPRQLTSGHFDEGDAFWSKDGTQVYFTSEHVEEPYYELPKTEVYTLPAQGGASEIAAHDPYGHRSARAQSRWQERGFYRLGERAG